MHTLLTALLQIALIGVAVYVCLVTWRRSEDSHGWFLKAEAQALKLRAERDRVTVLERELDALRRELRKLSGKFYAAQRQEACPSDGGEQDCAAFRRGADGYAAVASVCDNWALAQREGPSHSAAKCECLYCITQRANRERARRAAANDGKLTVQYALANRGSVVDRNGE